MYPVLKMRYFRRRRRSKENIPLFEHVSLSFFCYVRH